jgi:hypothetical protein
LPQLSFTVPQFFPAQGLPLAVHPHCPVTPAPPQVEGAVHEPQEIVLPHALAGEVPQLRPAHEGAAETVMPTELVLAASPEVLPLKFTELPHTVSVTDVAPPGA